jgi:hypothetical protein
LEQEIEREQHDQCGEREHERVQPRAKHDLLAIAKVLIYVAHAFSSVQGTALTGVLRLRRR